jgi:hypothetical protein
LKKWFFSSNIIKTPERRSIEKKKKKRGKRIEKEREKRVGKRKAHIVSSNKGEINILRSEKHFNFKIFFLMWFHFLPLHHTISKSLRKFFLTLFGPSFS